MKVDVEVLLTPSDREELFEEVRALGYEPEYRAPLEERGAELVWDAILWTRDHLAPGAAIALGTTVARWAWKKFRNRGARLGSVRVLYGPDGEVLAEVPIDDSLEDD